MLHLWEYMRLLLHRDNLQNTGDYKNFPIGSVKSYAQI